MASAFRRPLPSSTDWAIGAWLGTAWVLWPHLCLCLPTCWLLWRSLRGGIGGLCWLLLLCLWTPIRAPIAEVAEGSHVTVEPPPSLHRGPGKAWIAQGLHRPASCQVRLPGRAVPPGEYWLRRSAEGWELDWLGAPSGWRAAWKQGWRRLLEGAMGNSRGAALYSAMATGEASDPTLRPLLQRWGMVHLLAVSGLHVNLLLGMVRSVLRRVSRHPGVWLWGELCALLVYLVALGPFPSALRAGCMAGWQLLGRLLHRPVRAVHALCGSTALLLLWAPEWGQHLGFQLSVLATFALLVIAPPIGRVLERGGAGRKVGACLAPHLGVTLVTLPILLCRFHRYNLTGLLCNLIAAPLCSLGFTASLLAPLFGSFYGALLSMLTEWMLVLLALPQSWDRWTPPVEVSPAWAVSLLSMLLWVLEPGFFVAAWSGSRRAVRVCYTRWQALTVLTPLR